jgi:hypothetical protein
MQIRVPLLLCVHRVIASDAESLQSEFLLDGRAACPIPHRHARNGVDFPRGS